MRISHIPAASSEEQEQQSQNFVQERQELFDVLYREYVYEIASHVVFQHCGTHDETLIQQLVEEVLAHPR